MIKEMIARDRNHPSVIMWSLANEPKTDLPAAQPYFEYAFLFSFLACFSFAEKKL